MKPRRLSTVLAILLVGSTLLIDSCGQKPSDGRATPGKDQASEARRKSEVPKVIPAPTLKGMTIDQLNALDKPSLERLSAYDVIFMRESRDTSDPKKASTTAALLVKMPLHELYYEVELGSTSGVDSSRFRQAAREFQGKLKDPQTGVLTFGQWDRAQAFSKTFHSTHYFPGEGSNVKNYSLGTVVTVTGTLKIVGEEIATPINLVYGVADKSTMTYRQSVASLSTTFGADFLNLDETEFRIIEWGAEEIIGATDYDARNEKVIINRKTKLVSYVITDKPPQLGEDGKPKNYGLDPLKEPRISTLVRGMDAARAHYEKLRDGVRPYLSDNILNTFGN